MLKRIFIIALFLCGSYVFGQENDCKVMLESISGSYSGDCKNGLAHGKGSSKGVDYYEGQFSRGLPDGKGTYTWANGAFYQGQFKGGMKEGKGKMVTPDSSLVGYWKKDQYVGKELISPYVIHSDVGVSRSSIKKAIGSSNGIRMRILQGGADNVGIEDFSLAYDSGDEYRMGAVFGIQNVLFPLRVHVRYRTWNQFHTAQYDVFFEFSINDPGTWEVVINN